MRRTAQTAEQIYDEKLSQGVRNLLPMRELCIFAATAHDIGKASPAFQAHINGIGRNEPRHWNISYELLRRLGFDKTFCIVLASHHGKPPDNTLLSALRVGSYDRECGFGNPEYEAEHRLLLETAYSLSRLPREADTALDKPRQLLLTGFVILCDWIASSDDPPELPAAWISDGIGADELYGIRFGYSPTAVQRAVTDIFDMCNKPGLIIIEAPMGEGKTEAALAAAELMALRSERGGLFFALPTQATSNAMFSRVTEWLSKLELAEPHTIDLVHGKKRANYAYRELPVYGEPDAAKNDMLAVHSWLSGRKKAMLADFAIGTVDHLLMMALKQKHVMLRHLAIANKVVVIDECHAYDAFMDTYLCRALSWLGAYKTPTVILSATLTAAKRAELINAYLGKTDSLSLSAAYPLVTYINDGGDVCEIAAPASKSGVTIEISRIEDDALLERLSDALSDGGCAGIIVNTVKRAQELYMLLAARVENVVLIHSRFTASDRAEREQRVVSLLGPSGARPERIIVVGSQVLEQSLDIDFDILITDLCPMDLLIQRVGRLHRHSRTRPEKLQKPLCLVVENENSEKIYGKYLLSRTSVLLEDKITLPDDIAPLVNAAYDGTDAPGKSDYDDKIKAMQSRAEAFRLAAPNSGRPTIAGLLERSVSDTDKDAEASVRDGNDSIEVVVISEKERSALIRLTDVEAMERSVRLPFFFLKQAITELEANYKDDYGNLYLVLDENGTAELCGCRLTYSKEKGLEYERI
jgi:CRISPR-associated endonuclease/helicase Cas3